MMPTLRKTALPLALLLGLSACMEDAPLASPASQGGNTASLRDWIIGTTVEMRPVANPELFQVVTVTYNRDGTFTGFDATRQGVVTRTIAGTWSVRGGDVCQALNPVSITRPPLCAGVTVTGPDTAIRHARLGNQTMQVIARN